MGRHRPSPVYCVDTRGGVSHPNSDSSGRDGSAVVSGWSGVGGGVVAYTAEISRTNPTCFVFCIDQSGSMSDAIGGTESGFRTKSDVVADALNRLLQELALKCAKEEGVRDYFYVAVIGYGAHVGPCLGGALTGRELIPLSEVANNPARIEERMRKESDGAGGIVELPVKFPIWVDPVANGGTPMGAALRKARDIVQDFLALFPECFPPVVLNLTDGEPTDGDPSGVASEVQKLSSTDGNVLLFNLHVSSVGGSQVSFPNSEAELADDYARSLFRMSSVLPGHMRECASMQGYPVNEGARGFVFNADIAGIVQFLEIGTRATSLR